MQTLDAAPTRRLKEMVFQVFQDPELVQWWMRFLTMCPELATKADRLEVVDTAEAVRRAGHSNWLGRVGATGKDDWVWFGRTPNVGLFIDVLLKAAFGLDRNLAGALNFYFYQGVARRDKALVDFGRRVVEAAMNWTVEDVEKRLGSSLGRAYLIGGSIPLWADLEVGDEAFKPRNPEEFRRAEPHSFLDACLEGIYYQDTVFAPYAAMLFGPIPEHAPTCDSTP